MLALRALCGRGCGVPVLSADGEVPRSRRGGASGRPGDRNRGRRVGAGPGGPGLAGIERAGLRGVRQSHDHDPSPVAHRRSHTRLIGRVSMDASPPPRAWSPCPRGHRPESGVVDTGRATRPGAVEPIANDPGGRNARQRANVNRAPESDRRRGRELDVVRRSRRMVPLFGSCVIGSATPNSASAAGLGDCVGPPALLGRGAQLGVWQCPRPVVSRRSTRRSLDQEIGTRIFTNPGTLSKILSSETRCRP